MWSNRLFGNLICCLIYYTLNVYALPGMMSTDEVHDSPGASFCGFTACMSMCACVCTCVFVYVCVCVCVCVWAYVYRYVYVHVYLCVYV